jgi:hypothetical protein
MSSINIDALSEDELVELNHKIVARLRFLSQMRSHSEMLDFRIGEKVKFHPPGQPELTGTLTRYNKKSATVITEGGQHWNVAPGLLTKLDSQAGGSGATANTTVVFFSSRERKK